MPRLLSAASFALLLALGACSGPETVIVTDRPEPVVEPDEPQVVTRAAPTELDTVDVPRFATGRMWTFDAAPLGYFEETYSFSPDSAWLAQARLGALRFADYCSASFVSRHGLIVTNHHCARESIEEVSEEGEALLDSGFVAATLDAERRADSLYVDQLIDIVDVTEEVQEALSGIADDEQRLEILDRQEARIARRIERERTRDDLHVDLVPLYDGGLYHAYVYRRYDDVRLVMAPSLQLGSFGGDLDNFTYPRYSYDVAFFRAYDDAGRPVFSPRFFPIDSEGADAGEPVFTVGNPAVTSRHEVVAQLIYERDVDLPRQVALLAERERIFESYLAAHPDTLGLRDDLLSIQNNLKATRGQLAGLHDETLLRQRRALEAELLADILPVDSLRTRYGTVLEDLATLQQAKRVAARQAAPLEGFGSPLLSSRVLLRGLYAYLYDFYSDRPVAPERLAELRKDALEVEPRPAEVERELIAARLRLLQETLGPRSSTVQQLLRGRTPEAVADSVVAGTALLDEGRYRALFEERAFIGGDDPALPLVEALQPLYFTRGREEVSLSAREARLETLLGEARVALYGREPAPDATFSPRISDGIVAGYAYNGTVAPPFTTLFGLYDHAATYPDGSAWSLPPNWVPPPDDLDLSTPLNLVSTNDIAGGNSGSPLLDRDLRLVGVVFDSNIEALPNRYLFDDVRGRTISVDVRGIVEVLRDVYEADRLVLEMTTGRLEE